MKLNRDIDIQHYKFLYKNCDNIEKKDISFVCVFLYYFYYNALFYLLCPKDCKAYSKEVWNHDQPWDSYDINLL